MNPETSQLDPAIITLIIVGALALSIFGIIVAWRVFTKAGEPGWAAIIPLYNVFVEFRIAGFNPWLFLLLLVPLVNVVLALVVSYKIGEAFGKGPLFNVLWMVLFPIVGWLVLAFTDVTYRRPVNAV